jgi:Endonuclease NucS
MYRVDIKSKSLVALKPTSFSDLALRERFDIQEWIEKTPDILGEDLLVLGKEVTLPSGKRLDLLCIDRQGGLVIVELKRDDSGSSVEWQAIKYASYCSKLLPEEIFKQYAAYLGKSDAEAEKAIEEFIDTDIDALNREQRIILASRQFNSEVISAVLWLREYGLDIQCTRLAPYLDLDGELFIKPETIIPLPEAKDYIERKEFKQRVAATAAGEWSGFWFVNVGEGEHRTWEDNVQFGFVGAGQGKKYSAALLRLSVGDRIYAYMRGLGYVGFGEVTKPACMIRDFRTGQDDLPILQAGLKALKADENCESEDFSEWVVGIRWIKTVQKNQAKTFAGVFANQNVVCKLRHEETLKFVEREFAQ